MEGPTGNHGCRAPSLLRADARAARSRAAALARQALGPSLPLTSGQILIGQPRVDRAARRCSPRRHRHLPDRSSTPRPQGTARASAAIDQAGREVAPAGEPRLDPWPRRRRLRRLTVAGDGCGVMSAMRCSGDLTGPPGGTAGVIGRLRHPGRRSHGRPPVPRAVSDPFRPYRFHALVAKSCRYGARRLRP